MEYARVFIRNNNVAEKTFLCGSKSFRGQICKSGWVRGEAAFRSNGRILISKLELNSKKVELE